MKGAATRPVLIQLPAGTVEAAVEVLEAELLARERED